MLRKKMLRDMKQSKGQFISIFLLVFLGIGVYTGLNAIGHGMSVSSTEFYQQTNLADVFVYGSDFTEADVASLNEIDGIKVAEGRRQINATLEEDSAVTLQINYIKTNKISQMYVIEGTGYTPGADGIWLEVAFANENGYQVGDTISFLVNGVKQEEKIQGLVMHPEYVFAIKDANDPLPNHKLYGYGFLSMKDDSCNQILLDTELPKDEITMIVVNHFSGRQAVPIMSDKHPSVNMFDNEISQMEAVQVIFPFVFLLVAVLTILTTMTRITISQRLQIGVFKALGFSNRKILLHYMGYGLSISVVGSILGTLLGTALLPDLVFTFQKSMYSMPRWNKSFEWYIGLIVLFCIIACTICGMITARKELKGVTAQILRPKLVKSGKHLGLEKSKWWNRRGFDVQWNLRDVIRNPLRAFITVFGIVGSMALLLTGLGMKDTVENLIKMNYEQMDTSNTKVVIADTISQNDYDTLRQKEEYQFLLEVAVEAGTLNKHVATSINVIEEGPYLKQCNQDYEYVTLPEEGCMLSEKLAEELNLEIGDRIWILCYGTTQKLELEITNLLMNPIGQSIYMSQQAFEKAGGLFHPMSFVTSKSSDVFTGKRYEVVQSKEEMIHTMDELLLMMNTIIFIMIFAAA